MFKKCFGHKDDKPPDVIGAVIGAVVGVIGLIKQDKAAEEAEEAREQAALEQQRQQKIAANRAAAQQRRERMRQMVDARRSRANADWEMAMGGSGTSSGAFGAGSSLASQLGTNLAFQRGQSGYSQAIGASSQREAGFMNDMASAQTEANNWGAISNLGFQTSQQFGGFKTIFKSMS